MKLSIWLKFIHSHWVEVTGVKSQNFLKLFFLRLIESGGNIYDSQTRSKLYNNKIKTQQSSNFRNTKNGLFFK